MTTAISEPYLAEQQQVTNTIYDILAAAAAKDFDRLAAYHLDGPKFTKFDDFEPLERQDAATARRCEEEGLAGVEDLTYVVDGLQIDVFGPATVATFVLQYRFRADGQQVAMRARATMVFVTDGSAWKIAHEHFSPFVANAPG
jgi:ketosteroid isomerase-like protein